MATDSERQEYPDYEVLLRGDPCSYCGGVATEIDHIVARNQGGENGYGNLTASCSRCNQSKGARPLVWFLFERAREDLHPPQPEKGVRWRKDIRRWSATAHAGGQYHLLGSYLTVDQACAAMKEWREANPEAMNPRTRRRLERDARIKAMWHAGHTMNEIAKAEGVSRKAIGGAIDRMRARGEDVMLVGRGRPGGKRSPRQATSDGRGYSYRPGGGPPWLVQVQQGHRKLRARFHAEEEAQAAVAEFRAGMLAEGPLPRTALEHARRARGMSQEQLAARVGMTSAAISSLESGRTRRPHQKTRAVIAEALDMDEATLFDGMVLPKALMPEPAKPPPKPLAALQHAPEQDASRPWVIRACFATAEEAQAALAQFRAEHS